MGRNSVGRRGLAVAETRHLEWMLRQGLDRKTIEERTGRNYRTVRKAAEKLLPVQLQPQRYGRCRSCGGLVQMPCLLCRVRQTQDASNGNRSGD